MTRGNQREADREKAQKKLAGQNKTKESGNSLKARQEANGEIMRAKQAAAVLKAAGGGSVTPPTKT